MERGRGWSSNKRSRLFWGLLVLPTRCSETGAGIPRVRSGPSALVGNISATKGRAGDGGAAVSQEPPEPSLSPGAFSGAVSLSTLSTAQPATALKSAPRLGRLLLVSPGRKCLHLKQSSAGPQGGVTMRPLSRARPARAFKARPGGPFSRPEPPRRPHWGPSASCHRPVSQGLQSV